jgi:D-alanyl-D-alanine carboxypeptidase
MFLKTKKKKKKLNKYLKVTILLLVIFGFLTLLVILTEKTNGNNDIRITTATELVTNEETSEVTTMEEEITTTTKTTTNTTKSQNNSSGEFKKLNHNLSGATDKGKTSKGYSIQEKDGITYIDGYMVANKTYSLPENFNPGKLDSTVEQAASKMYAAAKSEKGYNMWGQSTFRSFETQKKLYNNYVARDGKTAADTYSARPGHSEHQTGLAFDVCAKNKPCISSDFNNTAEAKWLSDNAWRFGFILRYVNGKTNETGYKYESWHFRYVGSELAEKLYNNGNWITMENYFGFDSEYKN